MTKTEFAIRNLEKNLINIISPLEVKIFLLVYKKAKYITKQLYGIHDFYLPTLL